MEGSVNLAIPNCTNVPDHIAESSTIIEEGPRICPLCNSIVKLFFINFNEKVMMCENTECEFPFGYEELQFVKEDKEVGPEEELASVKGPISIFSGQESIATASVLSTAEWSEIDKINRAYDSEDNQSEECPYSSRGKDRMRAEEQARNKRKREEQMKKSIESIKALNKVIFKDKEEEDVISIHNENWIRKLLHMQNTSGVQLVKELEVNKLRRSEKRVGLGELVIDINNGNDMSSIKIEIVSNQNKNPSC